MKKQNKQFNEINKEINEQSKVMYLNVDLLNCPPFLCNSMFESWLFADNWRDILGFIFEKVLSMFIPNTLHECIGLELYDGESHDFKEEMKIYEKHTDMNEDKEIALKWLVHQYEKIRFEKEIETYEVKNMFELMKKYLIKVDVELIYEIYDNALEAVNSNSLATKEFDGNNLRSNFEF